MSGVHEGNTVFTAALDCLYCWDEYMFGTVLGEARDIVTDVQVGRISRAESITFHDVRW